MTKILLVEDERIVALHMRQMLKSLGYEVVASVSSGNDALLAVKREQPDIILMDIKIDGEIDGIQTASLIPQDLHIPVIYLTAYSEDATLARARATQPFAFLVKPFAERELHAAIMMALERKTVEDGLRQRQKKLETVLHLAKLDAWEIDPGTVRFIGEAPHHSISGRGDSFFSASYDSLLKRIHPDDRAIASHALHPSDAQMRIADIEFRLQQADGSYRWIKFQGQRLNDSDGGAGHIFGVAQDVTERRQVERQLMEAATVFDVSDDGVVILDPDFLVLAVNPAFRRLTGYSDAQLVGHHPTMLGDAWQTENFFRHLRAALTDNGRWRSELQMSNRSGDSLPVSVRVAAVSDSNDKILHYVVLVSDLTSVQSAQKALEQLAHYDCLTALPNRLLAMDRLRHAIDRASREKSIIGLMFVDLDHFKQVNDTLGHAAGDELLQLMADRLRAAVRADDTVARLGGDEFLIVLERIGQPADAAHAAAKVMAAMAQPCRIGGQPWTMSGSVGISLFPNDGLTHEAMIRAADTAMYVAKQRGRANYAFFSADMNADTQIFLGQEADLRRGFLANEFTLLYQPQVGFPGQTLVGVEALLRWRHPDRGLLGAEHIIPLAEKSGLIVAIGEWVLRQAVQQLACWEVAGLTGFRLAVNVSPQHVRQKRLLRVIEDLLGGQPSAVGRLELEVTESFLLEDEGEETIMSLNRLGVGLAVDSYGTGCSCLATLRTLPIQRLKIDRRFVAGLLTGGNGAAIVETIIAIARRLNMTVIAEGIENAEEVAILKARGCQEFQGELFGAPMPPDEIGGMSTPSLRRMGT